MESEVIVTASSASEVSVSKTTTSARGSPKLFVDVGADDGMLGSHHGEEVRPGRAARSRAADHVLRVATECGLEFRMQE